MPSYEWSRTDARGPLVRPDQIGQIIAAPIDDAVGDRLIVLQKPAYPMELAARLRTAITVAGADPTEGISHSRRAKLAL